VEPIRENEVWGKISFMSVGANLKRCMKKITVEGRYL